ncbi:MAG: PAS domain S-box protein [Deltaproteobacteria bacterium]|nr:PAS domain S-box protein [Deltaproteobacteria bacterium]
MSVKKMTEYGEDKINPRTNPVSRLLSLFHLDKAPGSRSAGLRKFSTVLMITITSLVMISVVVVLFILNRYFDERVEKEFRKKLQAEKGQIEILIKNRLDDVTKVLKDLSTDNTIRVTMMLDAETKLTERIWQTYPPENGVYPLIQKSGTGMVIPQNYNSLSKETVLHALYLWPRGDVLPDKGNPRLLWIFSQPITGTDGDMGTAVILYDMLEDILLGESIKSAVKGELQFLHGGQLIGLGGNLPDNSRPGFLEEPGDNAQDFRIAGDLAYSQIVSNKNLYYVSSALDLLSERRKVTLLMWVFSATIMSVSVLISVFLAAKMARPLKEMTRKAILISEGNDIPLNFERNTEYWEFDQLSEAFNTMFTHLKEAQERSRYQELLDNVDDAVYIIDKRGLIIEANSAAYEPLGYTRDQFYDLRLSAIMPPVDYKRIIGLEEPPEDQAANKKLTIETVHIGKQGRSIPVEIQSRLINYMGNSVILNVARNITERIEAEKHKNFLESQLNHAQKMEALGTMAGCIAHDFNNLLTGIQANVEILSLELKPGQPAYSRLEAMEKTIDRATSLTRQLLGFARKEKGEFEPLNINTLVDESTGLFIKSRKEIKLGLYFGADILPVSGDRGQLEQVLVNLYINAWHAMPGGGDLSIYTKNVRLDDTFCRPFELPGGDYVHIIVSDTGTGMSNETMDKIFEPFFTTKESGKGTGLGLASAYGIIMNHKGMITVESKIGEGTTFNIFLPAVSTVKKN